MKKIFTLTIILLNSIAVIAQNFTGTITDAETKKPLVGASVTIKGKNTGTISNNQGFFSLKTSTKPPFTLVFTMIGFERQTIDVTDNNPITVSLKAGDELLQQVVISASRIEENILKSPISIEKIDSKAIQQSPSVSFYDALVNVKSLDMVTSGLTYKQINTRGFNSTGNSRFLQLIDGVDNQSPGLGFAVGNLFGSSDLDIEGVELIPGAASALYGPVAFNGLLMTTSKNPFTYEGLSVQTKVGINHVSDNASGAKPFTDFALRYAKAFNNRFAFKLNTSYLKGTDWYANNYTDIDPNTPAAQRGDSNPGRNALNIYGDEVAQTITGIGRVSRTGYEEKDLANYGVYSTKLNAALHYKISESLEAIYQVNYSQGTANYTGSSRFALNDFKLIQNRVELRGTNFFIRGYSTAEQSNNSYNTRSLGQLINRTWVRDLNGNVVTPDKADATWFERYTAAYTGKVTSVGAQDHSAARAFADQGRFIPGSSDFEQQKSKYIATAGLGGAGVLSNSKLYHIDAQYDLSQTLKVVNLLVGGSYRVYDMETNGTLFDDKINKVSVKEYGVFAQASKSILEDQLKLTLSGRYDKNENFNGSFTPRASAVFSPSTNHNFRASYQTGFRNPTVPDQFIKLNVGPIIILGGAPANSAGLNAYENSFTAASVGAFASGFSSDLQKGVAFPTAVENNKSKLVKSNVPYIKPEQTQSFEIGYKGLLAQKFLIDVNYYRSTFTDFLINQVVIRPSSNVLNSDGTINSAAAQDILGGKTQAFQLYTNAADKVSSQGVSLGLTYFLPDNYRVGFNTTWSDFNIMDANPNNIPAFNTPRWKTNLTLSNSKITDRLGFSVAWHWQESFDWYGTFNENRPGNVPAYSLIDAQVNYRVPALKTTVKLGANNLTNNYIVQAYGSPAVGGLYYVSLTFDELFR
ncbi:MULTISPECIES: TonB-dependent receptor [unclassified Arcicella]|uniref:TonB-dependent receptor n=1 Tax=unclassified Arcicella TaxID=2644986 RepID=UPI0028589D1E|nr:MULTISPECIES: TonB-dependent receptor [unclassified Arcicella]MDR6561166.1 outer membrane receptor protein involved in Fe transport [Arcicella sp. BE51]MDR6811050.1 outer membrane receptor protein involved in Fe transport [Arcicella sp. BE140]MDR6822400.1 outer membrane receptor protein involved in Fe transport [Arcicella sp. BE139]